MKLLASSELIMWSAFFALAAIAAAFPVDFAFAQAFGAGGPAEGLTNTQQYFQNAVVRPIGGLLLMLSGIQLFRGQHHWYDFVPGLAGIGVMVKPDWIMTNLFHVT